ncbi:hypothetical protein ACEK07_25210 [Alcanivoracaceae bacterium MT1]
MDRATKPLWELPWRRIQREFISPESIAPAIAPQFVHIRLLFGYKPLPYKYILAFP